MEKINFILNGENVTVESNPHRTLLHLLREDFGLTGTKNGCEEGECGACTVIMNGDAVTACLVPSFQVDGAVIETIESLAGNSRVLHPIQKAFLDADAVQCGYCTPGMIMSVKAMLDKIKTPTREHIKQYISGNICRCTGYEKIIKAVEIVSKGVSENE